MAQVITLPAELSFPGIRLRQPRPEDAPDAFAWTSDPEVTRYLSFRPHRSMEESRAVLRRWARTWAELGGNLSGGRSLTYLLIVEERAVGSLSLYQGRYGIEIGYALARDCWGQGLMHRAVDGVAGWLLDGRTRRVTATAHIANAASHRVLEKAGFLREGRLSQYFYFPNLEAWGDGYLYARVR